MMNAKNDLIDDDAVGEGRRTVVLIHQCRGVGEDRMQEHSDEWERVNVKSFKHDGSVHRIWQDNWIVPAEKLLLTQQEQHMCVVVHPGGRQSKEKEGHMVWTSRTPSVTFFVPKMWFNIVALLEKQGVRYYCNIASPFTRYAQTITYIDYDLDVIKYPDGSSYVIDQDDYQRHRKQYQYSREVERKVRQGLHGLLRLINERQQPFDDETVVQYYEWWMAMRAKWQLL